MLGVHLDAAAEATLAQLDVAILGALLVVASVIQLGGTGSSSSFSIKLAQAWRRSKVVLYTLEALILASTLGALSSVLGMAVSRKDVRIFSLFLTMASIVMFASVSVLTVRWFYRNSDAG